ncbi:hypothetical protein OAG82_04370, partial [Rubripirellula sp.]
MNFKILFCTLGLMLCACTAQAAPLLHSIVLDDFSDTVAFNIQSGQSEVAYSFATTGSPGVTGRRDIGLAYQTVGPYSGLGATIAGGSGSITYTDVAGLGVAPVGFAFQYDYGTTMNAIDPLTGLDTGTPTETLSAGWSKYVIDVGTVVGSYDVTFYVMGDTSADYATATQTISDADSDSLLEFDRVDFYGDLNGDFTGNPSPSTPWINWAPYVTSYGIQVVAGNSVAGQSIQF